CRESRPSSAPRRRYSSLPSGCPRKRSGRILRGRRSPRMSGSSNLYLPSRWTCSHSNGETCTHAARGTGSPVSARCSPAAARYRVFQTTSALIVRLKHEEEAMPKPKYILELTRTDGCPVSHLGAV